jgi:hypothetical protein
MAMVLKYTIMYRRINKKIKKLKIGHTNLELVSALG